MDERTETMEGPFDELKEMANSGRGTGTLDGLKTMQPYDYNLNPLDMNYEVDKGLQERQMELYSKGFASMFAEQIHREMCSFDANLNDDEAVGVKLVQYGESIQFHIEGVGFQNPYLLYFHGRMEDGSPVKLIQHVSQISFIMLKLKRQVEAPKRPIGFCPITTK